MILIIIEAWRLERLPSQSKCHLQVTHGTAKPSDLCWCSPNSSAASPGKESGPHMGGYQTHGACENPGSMSLSNLILLPYAMGDHMQFCQVIMGFSPVPPPAVPLW